MRKVKLEDLKKGVEIQWYEHGRKYIIESLGETYAVIAGYSISIVSISDILENCYIKESLGMARFNDKTYANMTFEEWYEIKEDNGEYYQVKDDDGLLIYVHKDLFSMDIHVEGIHSSKPDSPSSLRVGNTWIIPALKKETPLPEQYPHYYKDVSNLKAIDVYRVLELFEVNDPCIQHAIKKLLAIGNRGVKDHDRDFREIMDTLKRYEEMRNEDAK